MLTVEDATFAWEPLFNLCFATENAMPSAEDRVLAVVILALHVLLGLSTFIAIAGLSPKRPGFALAYFILMCINATVNAVAGYTVVRHINKGSDDMPDVQRRVKLLIQGTWILSALLVPLYASCVVHYRRLRRRGYTRVHPNGETVRWGPVVKTRLTRTFTVAEINSGVDLRWKDQIQREWKDLREAPAGAYDMVMAMILYHSTHIEECACCQSSEASREIVVEDKQGGGKEKDADLGA